MFGWLKNVRKKVRDLNVSVDTYKKETENQALPSLAYVNRAKKLIDKSMFLEAKDVLTEALSITQKDSLVYKYLGYCEENLGNFAIAIDMYKKSASINPQDKNVWHKLGMTQVTVKDYESAEKSFEQANKVTPVNTDVQTGWGMALLKQKKYNEALEKFIKAIKINRYNFSAMLLAAIVEIRLKKYDDAQTKLTFLIKTNPTEGAAYEFANLCFLKENLDEAVKYALKSIEFNPSMLPAYLLLGKIYSFKFDYENSMKYFTLAEDKKLINSLLYVEWGNALIRLYRFSEAKEMFSKALTEDADSVEAQSGMALCTAETEDYSKARELIHNILEKQPDDIFSIEAQGVCEFAQGNIQNAIDCFKKALNIAPKEFYNYYRVAKCYEKLNKNDMVQDSYDKMIKFNPEFTRAYIEYAEYLMSIKDYKNAQRKLRKAENLDKNNQQILNSLFYTSYILVKDNVCEYNIKEAISLADRIDEFKYPELRADLEVLLKNVKENQ